MRNVYFLFLTSFLACSVEDSNTVVNADVKALDTLAIITQAAADNSNLKRQAQAVYFGDSSKQLQDWSLNTYQDVSIRTHLLSNYPLYLDGDSVSIEVLDSAKSRFRITPLAEKVTINVYRNYGEEGVVLSFTDYDNEFDSLVTYYSRLKGLDTVTRWQISTIKN